MVGPENAPDLDPEEVIWGTKYATRGREKTPKEVQDDLGVGMQYYGKFIFLS